jgi:hypothetical protein
MEIILRDDSERILLQGAIDNSLVVISNRNTYLSSKVRIALAKLSEDELSNLVTVLNKINNQGICRIDNKVMVYDTVNARSIDIEFLCSAEKLYLVSFLAQVGYIRLVVFANMLGLEHEQCKEYFKYFKNADIIVITSDIINDYAIREAMQND